MMPSREGSERAKVRMAQLHQWWIGYLVLKQEQYDLFSGVCRSFFPGLPQCMGTGQMTSMRDSAARKLDPIPTHLPIGELL